MHDDLLKYKIALGLIPKIGPVLTKRLIAYCGNAETVFREKKSVLEKIPGIGKKLAAYIADHKDIETAEKEVDTISKNGISVLFYLDNNYPERLRQCEDAPIILYVTGNAPLHSSKVISVVGTRNPTDYGKTLTRELVTSLAANYPDIIIVSGLAYGIDICAHKAALKNRLNTIAVLGHGLSNIYPAPHRETAQKIMQNGALITEFLYEAKPDAPNFVKRNRIVAGLADATIVVESGEKGGALITADIAGSYNRDVFAFPGKVHDTYSAGCNQLIKSNKAAMIENIADLEYLMGWQIQRKSNKAVQTNLFVNLTHEEKQVMEYLQQDPLLTIDQLAMRCNMPMSKISAMLLSLEFKGVVKCLPGKAYSLV